jgi:hypothetical protein
VLLIDILSVGFAPERTSPLSACVADVPATFVAARRREALTQARTLLLAADGATVRVPLDTDQPPQLAPGTLFFSCSACATLM